MIHVGTTFRDATGTLIDVTSVKLRSPDGTVGMVRRDTGVSVVAPGTVVPRLSLGTYGLDVAEPAVGLVYNYWFEVVIGARTLWFEKERSLAVVGLDGDGLLAVDAVLTGTLTVEATFVFTATIYGDAVLSGSANVVTVPSPLIVSEAFLSGFAVVTSMPVSTPEGRMEGLGFLPAVPLVVYGEPLIDAQNDYAGPDNGSFLVAATYMPSLGDGMAEFGALPGYVGTFVVRAGIPDGWAYRPPLYREVVWAVDPTIATGSAHNIHLRRWDGDRWQVYRSLPQRSFDGQYVFQIADPDGFWDYFAELLGGMHAQTAFDCYGVASLLSLEMTPGDYLASAARQFGVYDLPNATDDGDRNLTARRFWAKDGVEANRERGQPSGIARKLRALGYDGYLLEAWIDPAHPTTRLYQAHGSTPPSSPYVLSNFVQVVVNRFDGSPVYGGAAERASIAKAVQTVLPAQTLIDGFGTEDGSVVRWA